MRIVLTNITQEILFLNIPLGEAKYIQGNIPANNSIDIGDYITEEEVPENVTIQALITDQKVSLSFMADGFNAIETNLSAIQGVASSETILLGSSSKYGRILSIRALTDAIPATGESLSIDIQKVEEGSDEYISVLDNLIILNAENCSTPGKVVLSTASSNKFVVSTNDRFKAIFSYVSGETPSPIVNTRLEVLLGRP